MSRAFIPKIVSDCNFSCQKCAVSETHEKKNSINGEQEEFHPSKKQAKPQ
jgi:hypothetical protein